MANDPKNKENVPKEQQSPLSAIAEAYKQSETYEPPKNDYELFFFQDPFALDLEPSDSRNASNLPDVLDLIKRIFAMSRRGFDTLVFGPTGIGKTLLARSVAAAYDQGYIDRKTVYIDAATSEEDFWTNIYTSELVIIDNAAPIWMQSIAPPIDGSRNRATVAAFLSYFDYKRLTDWSKNMGFSNFPLLGSTDYKKIPVPSFSERSIVDILRTRITASCREAVGTCGFSNESLFEIARYSIGLPSLALLIARDVLGEFVSSHEISEDISASFVHEVVRGSPYSMAHALVRSVNTAEILIDAESRIKLTMGSTRMEVLVTMAQMAFSRGNSRFGPFSVERQALEQELGKPSSTISHHAQKLIAAGLLQAQREGNTVSYLLSTPVYHALELLSYPYLKS